MSFNSVYWFFGVSNFEGRIWDLIVSVPDHCLSFYFDRLLCALSTVTSARHSTNPNTNTPREDPDLCFMLLHGAGTMFMVYLQTRTTAAHLSLVLKSTRVIQH